MKIQCQCVCHGKGAVNAPQKKCNHCSPPTADRTGDKGRISKIEEKLAMEILVSDPPFMEWKEDDAPTKWHLNKAKLYEFIITLLRK